MRFYHMLEWPRYKFVLKLRLFIIRLGNFGSIYMMYKVNKKFLTYFFGHHKIICRYDIKKW